MKKKVVATILCLTLMLTSVITPIYANENSDTNSLTAVVAVVGKDEVVIDIGVYSLAYNAGKGNQLYDYLYGSTGIKLISVASGNKYMDIGDYSLNYEKYGSTGAISNTPALSKESISEYKVFKGFDENGNPILLPLFEPKTRNIVSIKNVSDIVVNNGTTKENIGLPTNVILVLDDSIEKEANVIWNEGKPNYDGNTAGEYIFTGTIILPENVLNPKELKAEVKVLVEKSADKAAADEVIAQINGLPVVEEINLADKEAVAVARAAYDSLTAGQKELVGQEVLDKLIAAENRIKELEEEEIAAGKLAAAIKAAEEAIKQLPTVENVKIEDKAAVENAKALVAEVKVLKSDAKVEGEELIALLEAKIAELEADKAVEEEANNFKTANAEILLKTVDTIAISDKESVNAALTAYGELSEAAKGKLTSEKTLLDSLLTKIGELEKVDGDKAAADEVIAQINGLPAEIALENKAAVEAARAAYDSLNDEQKKLVTNLDKLAAAEAKIAELEADKAATEEANDFKATHAEILGKTVDIIAISDKESINTALVAYDKLSEAAKGKLTVEKALLDSLLTKIGELEKEAADKAAAQAVIDKINELPELTSLTLENREAVEATRAAYESLTVEQKKLVTNLDKLTSAETKIDELVIEDIDDRINVALSKLKYDGTGIEVVTYADKTATFFISDLDTKAYMFMNSGIMDLFTAMFKDVVSMRINDGENISVQDPMVAAIQIMSALLDLDQPDLDKLKSVTMAELEGKQVNLELTIKPGTKEYKENYVVKFTMSDKLIAQAVIEKINALPELTNLTLADKEAVVAARAAYDSLNDEQKKLVPNLDKLTAAEAKIAELEADKAATDEANDFKVTHATALNLTVDTVAIGDKETVNATLTAYGQISEAAKTKLTAEKTLLDSLLDKIGQLEQAAADQLAAQAVMDTINQLPAAEALTLGNKVAVVAARDAYNDLTAEQKELVGQEVLDKLIAAENRIKELEAEETAAEKLAAAIKAAEEAINQLPTVENVKIEDKAAVENAKALVAEVKALKFDAKVEGEELIALLEARIAELEAEKAATEEANSFKTTHAEILGKRVDNIEIADKPTVNTALSAYEELSDLAKGKLTSEKALLDSLITKIGELEKAAADKAAAQAVMDTINQLPAAEALTLGNKAVVVAAREAYDKLIEVQKALVTNLDKLEAAEAKIKELEADQAATEEANSFKTDHATALDLTVDTVAIGDKESVSAALAAYDKLSAAAKEKLTSEKALLDSLLTKIGELEQAEADEAAAQAVIDMIEALPENLTLANKEAVEAARDAYDKLAEVQKALIGKETLDKLTAVEAKIAELEADKVATEEANSFKATHATALDLTVDTVVIGDKESVNAALAAYDKLSAAAKEKLTSENALLDSLLTKIGELEELVATKEKAKAELATYKKASDYREAEQTALTTAITDGNIAIDAATDIEGVNVALLEAKKVIDLIKTDIQLKLEEAKKMAEDKVKEEYTITSWDTLTKALALPEITSEEVVDKTTAINAAITSLVKKLDTNDIWNGNSEAFSLLDPSNSDNSEANPYIIDTSAKLANLATQVRSGNNYEGKYFVLDANLNLNGLLWVAIGDWDDTNSRHSFNGYFDGNNNTITGMKINEPNKCAGLFSVTKNAQIKNLTVLDPIITRDSNPNDYGSYGVIVGEAYDSKFEEIHVINPTINGGWWIGGLFGYCAKATITNCSVTGGSITATNWKVGGITAGAYDVTIKDCVVNGTTIYTSATGFDNDIGGIIGYLETKDYEKSVIENCSFDGSVTASNNYAGGIVGHIKGVVEVTNCTTKGTITGLDYIGGILGANDGTTTIADSISHAKTSGINYIGGIVGYGTANTIIENNTSDGVVTGESNVGQIAGIIANKFPNGLSDDNRITNFVNDSTYPWEHDVSIKGKVAFYPTNQGKGSSTSSFTCVVKGKGAFAYDYKVSAEDNWDYLKVYVDDEVVKEYKTLTDWTSDYIILSNDTQIVKFEYKKDSGGDSNDDKVWIANLRLSTGSAELTLTPNDEELGTVSNSSGIYDIGTEVEVIATEKDADTIAFVGWFDNTTHEWLTGDGTTRVSPAYKFDIIENRDITAFFKRISLMPELTLNHDSDNPQIINDGGLIVRKQNTDSNKYVISLGENITASTIAATQNGTQIVPDETGAFEFTIDGNSTIVFTSSKENYVTTYLSFGIKVLYNLDGLVESSSVGNITVTNDLDYPWKKDSSVTNKVAYYPTNQGVSNSSPKITCKVIGSGLLSYDYKVSAENRYDYLKVYVDDVLAKEYKTLTDWTSDYIILSNDTQIVKFEYKKDGSGDKNDDKVWIANIGLCSEDVPLKLTVDGSEYGSISGTYGNNELSTGVHQIPVGTEIKLNAIANSGASFYGWVDKNGKLLSTNANYTFNMIKETDIKAIFAQNGTYVARKDGVFYQDLATALKEAVSGDTIRLIDNCTLNETTTVPEGVTLMIPYNATTTSPTEKGTTSTATGRVSWTNESKYLYLTLTIPEGITLNVNGTMIVGAVQHYPAQNYQGNTSGAYSQIICDGAINVNNGGVLDLYGLLKGSGTVTAYSGAKIYQPFMIADYAGGTNTQDLFGLNQTPFNRYAMVNIQTDLVMHYGSTMYGHASLYFWHSITIIDSVFVGEGGLIVLSDGATLTATYDANKYVEHSVANNNLNKDIGKTTIVISGGAKSGYMQFPLGIDTSKVYFAIPYNYDIVLENGNYNFEYPYKLMPGASLWVKNDAILEVTSGLYVYDGLIQSDMSGKSYPTTAMLQQCHFSPSANFIVDGTFIVRSGKTFGGIIQTNGGVKVILEENTNVANETVADGGKTGYDVNTSKFALPARVYDADSKSLIVMESGKTYLGQENTESWSLTDYTCTYAKTANESDYDADISKAGSWYHKWTTTTTTINQPMIGSWCVQGATVD